MPTPTHTQESESQLPKTTEERFDKEIGLIEEYKLYISQEDSSEREVAYEVKKFLAQELERVREETITQMTLNPDQRSEERARGKAEGIKEERERIIEKLRDRSDDIGAASFKIIDEESSLAHQAEIIDHSIDVRYEPDLIEMVNKFIKKWCGKYYGHLIDDDENDGQFLREAIENAIQSAHQAGKAEEREKIADYLRKKYQKEIGDWMWEFLETTRNLNYLNT